MNERHNVVGPNGNMAPNEWWPSLLGRAQISKNSTVYSTSCDFTIDFTWSFSSEHFSLNSHSIFGVTDLVGVSTQPPDIEIGIFHFPAGGSLSFPAFFLSGDFQFRRIRYKATVESDCLFPRIKAAKKFAGHPKKNSHKANTCGPSTIEKIVCENTKRCRQVVGEGFSVTDSSKRMWIVDDRRLTERKAGIKCHSSFFMCFLFRKLPPPSPVYAIWLSALISTPTMAYVFHMTYIKL